MKSKNWLQTLASSLLIITLAASTSFAISENNKYPIGPHLEMTPGKLCDHPSEQRYPEQIDYCERNVSTSTKRAVIEKYDKQLGFQIRTMNRSDFKIDHFIPLSIGGSNDVENLWPQHKSVYEMSDRIESHVANLMADGRIKQVEAIRVVKECKLNLDRCEELEHYLKGLY